MRLFILIGSLLVAAMSFVGCSDPIQATGCMTDEPCRNDRVCCEGVCAEREACFGECVSPLENANETLSIGLEADEFYGRFVRGEAEEAAVGYGVIPEQSSSGFNVHLFLFECGGATVLYEEGFLGHGFNPYGDFGGGESHKTRIETGWSIEGERLVVGEVLDCVGQMSGEASYSMSCILVNAVGSPEAVGGSASLRPEASVPSPDDEEFADFQ
ncbi:hypothetical protein FRC91_11655 [Bradymonadales bacterium TMQ1]|nr:hypothetical protein FRC91_11655 [Bradymonadales bacterium TMQ1]